MPSDTDDQSPTAAEMGRKGGAARAARMTPEERSESARKASLARWRRDLAEISAELEAIPDCPRCGCPLSIEHPEHAVTVDTLVRSMPDGVVE